MKTYVALIRGINVSGKNMIKMPDLISALQVAGLVNIRTYIQSGNLVFESQILDTAKLASIISARMKHHFGFEVQVVVMLQAELLSIKNENPFFKLQFPNNQLYVTFLETIPDTARLELLMQADFSPDEFVASGRAIYLCCKSGYGKTRLTNVFFENKLKMKATTRNWNTISKLCSM